MHLAAIDHVKDGELTGVTGHTSSDGTSFMMRIFRYVKWGVRIAEICQYGSSDSLGAIAHLIKSKGHRGAIHNGKHRYCGCSMGPHKNTRYSAVCVFTYNIRGYHDTVK